MDSQEPNTHGAVLAVGPPLMGAEPGCWLVARGRATTLRLPILMNDSYPQGELKKSSGEVC